MSKRSAGHEGQMDLLSGGETAPSADIGEQMEMTTGDPIAAPAVGAVEHYEHLAKVLGYFGSMNKGDNFRARFREGSPVVRSRFEPQYRSVNKKFDESTEAADTLDELALAEFAKAFGSEALVASGVATEREADAMAKEDYQRFKGSYGGLGNKKARTSYLGKVNRRTEKFKKVAASA